MTILTCGIVKPVSTLETITRRRGQSFAFPVKVQVAAPALQILLATGRQDDHPPDFPQSGMKTRRPSRPSRANATSSAPGSRRVHRLMADVVKTFRARDLDRLRQVAPQIFCGKRSRHHHRLEVGPRDLP